MILSILLFALMVLYIITTCINFSIYNVVKKIDLESQALIFGFEAIKLAISMMTFPPLVLIFYTVVEMVLCYVAEVDYFMQNYFIFARFERSDIHWARRFFISGIVELIPISLWLAGIVLWSKYLPTRMTSCENFASSVTKDTEMATSLLNHLAKKGFRIGTDEGGFAKLTFDPVAVCGSLKTLWTSNMIYLIVSLATVTNIFMVAVLRLPPWIAPIYLVVKLSVKGFGFYLLFTFYALLYFFKSPIIALRFFRLIKRKWRRRTYTFNLQENYSRFRETQRTQQASYRAQQRIFGGGISVLTFDFEQRPSCSLTNDANDGKIKPSEDSIPLVNLLGNQVIMFEISTYLHYYDLVNLSLTSRLVREAVFPSSDSGRVLHYRRLACVNFECDIHEIKACHICRVLMRSDNWIERPILYKQPAQNESLSTVVRRPLSAEHLRNCKPVCTKCYLRYPGLTRSTIRRAARGFLCSTVKESRLRASKAPIRVAICQLQKTAMERDSCVVYLCNNCHELEDVDKRVDETMEINLRKEFLAKEEAQCFDCQAILGAGPRWRVCKGCNNECLHDYHPGWLTRKDIQKIAEGQRNSPTNASTEG